MRKSNCIRAYAFFYYKKSKQFQINKKTIEQILKIYKAIKVLFKFNGKIK